MGSRTVRTIHDFARHGYALELACGCGHRAQLAPWPVAARFHAVGWPIGLGDAAARFRCGACGKRGPAIAIGRGG